MMSRDTKCGSRLTPPEKLIGPCCCVIYPATSLKAVLERIGVFPDIMGQTNQLSQFLCAKWHGKAAAKLGGSLQMLKNRLLSAVLRDVGEICHTTKDGQTFYEIRVSRGRGKSYLTTRWYPPEGWSQKAIDRALVKEAAEFERRCHDGEVVTRAEQKESDLRQKREAAKIQTLQEYGETVFMPAKGVTMSENGRCAYQGNLNHWIYPALGDLKMPDITSSNISALLLSMQSQGKAHATCVKIYTILHSLFKMAYMGDVVTTNPMDKVERPKLRKGEIKDRDVEA